MLYSSLFLSIFPAIIALTATYRPTEWRGTYVVAWLLPLLGFVPCAYIAPAYMLHAALSAAAITACRRIGARPRSFVLAAAAAFIVGYGSFAIPRAMELWRLTQEYPFNSIEGRLAYEAQRPTRPPTARASGPDETLDDAYARRCAGGYVQHHEAALKDLHDGCVQLFVDAPGFGIARMSGASIYYLRVADPIRDAQPVALPEIPAAGTINPLSSADLALPTAGSAETGSKFGRDDLDGLLSNSFMDFLDPSGFGYVRDRAHVAGFVSHRFTRFPSKPDGANNWRFESLDLISLLKYPEPVAYVSKHLPRMDELRDAPTRPLDEFEAEQLPKLRAGEELAAAQGPRRVRMLGAIRARAECLKCHSVESNELLGAFSYDLRRDY